MSPKSFSAWIGQSGYTNVGGDSLSIVLPVIGGGSLKIEPQNEYSAQIYLCKTFSVPVADGETPNLCAGETGRRTIATETTITLPADCRFVVFGYRNSGLIVGPTVVALDGINLIDGMFAIVKAQSEAIATNASDITSVEDNVENINTLLYALKFGLSNIEPTNGQIANTNVFILDAGSHKVLQVVPGMTLKIKKQGNFLAQVFWLKTYSKPTAESYTPDFCSGHTSRESLDSGTYTVPSDCHFIAIGYLSGSINIFPSEMTLNDCDVINPIYSNFESVYSEIDNIAEEPMMLRVIYGKYCDAFRAWIGSTGTYTMVGELDVLSNVIPVTGGKNLRVVPRDGYSVQLFLCKTFTIPTYNGQIPDLCAGETGRRTIETESQITLPDDCRFVVYGVKNSNMDVSPDGLYIENVNLSDGILLDMQNSGGENGAYERNIDKTGRLLNASRKNIESDGSKDTQIVLLGDQHQDSLAISNAIEIMNGFDTVDAMLNMGDCSNAFNSGYAATYMAMLAKATKPIYHTLGNHDVGYSPLVGVSGSNQQCFDKWIAPVIAKGWLQNGEYQANKCYYYHDFTQGKTRLIVLYAYDDDNEFYTGYWEPVVYDSTKPTIVNGNTYAIGDIVNVPNYTEHSFRCVSPVTVDSSATTPTQPSYKFERGINVIRQAQAQWFLDTLAATPENYSVIVAIHGVPTEQFAIDHSKGGVFCQDLNKTAVAFGGYGMYDFIADAVNAFVNGTVFNQTVTFKSYTGFDGLSAKYAQDYVVSKDFSVKNAGVQFHCWLCGHTHYDLVWKHNTYLQYCINPLGANTDYARNHVFGEGGISATDICRTDTDGPAKDSLTVIAFNNSRSMKKVALAKVGVDVTIDAVKRDYAVLNLAD